VLIWRQPHSTLRQCLKSHDHFGDFRFIFNLGSVTQMDDERILKTPDLHFAAFLLVKGCRIVSVKRERSKRTFSFDTSQSSIPAADLRYGYFNGDSDQRFLVDPIRYSDAIRSMKTLCHVELSSQEITTPDLYFASFLHAMRCTLKDVRRSTRKTVFIFDAQSSGQISHDLLLQYFNGCESGYCVNALTYNESIRELKELCSID